MKKMIAAALAATLAVSSLALSACNNNPSGNQDSQSAQTSEQSSEQSVEESKKEEPSDISAVESKPDITDAQLSRLSDNINAYKKVPEFTSDSERIEARSISKGKKVTFIADNMSKTFTSLVAREFSRACTSAGFKKTYAEDSDGSPAFYNEQLENAVENSNIVVMYGDINKDVVGTNIEKVQAHGKRVLSAGNVGKNELDHYVDYTIPIDYEITGKLMTDWAVYESKGKVNALAVNNSDSTLSSSIFHGFADEFKEYVTSGYCTVLSGSSIEIGNGLTTKIKQAIDKDPNLNYIIVLDEGMISDTVSAVEQSGKDIKIIATGGGRDALGAAETGKVDMLVAQSYEWTAYAMTDYVLRVLDKAELPKQQDVPVRIVTAESIKKDLEENTYNDIDGFYEICFGANFMIGYNSMWSL